MPFRVFIAGSGRQSIAAGYDILKFDKGASLTLYDMSHAQVERAANRLRELVPDADIECQVGDVDNVPATAVGMQGHDAALAGVPYYLNPKVHAAARRASILSVDMGSDLPDLEAELGKRSEDHSSTAIFDTGLAPGLGNQLARGLVESLADAEIAKIYCGGLPLEPRTPFKYRPRFSLAGLVGEYSDAAVALKGGKVVALESLSELERVEVPELGALEAFVTSGGSSISPILFEGKLKTFEYKTLRFPGHCEAMRAYRDLGLWSHDSIDAGGARLRPIELFERMFTRATAGEDPRDQVVLLVEAIGNTGTKRQFVRQSFNPETGLSAMEQLTGFCASIVLLQAVDQDLAPGLYASEEVVSAQTMIGELAKRGITVQDLE